EDLNQLWALVKETFNIRSAANDKEKELWVELKRLKPLSMKQQREFYMSVLRSHADTQIKGRSLDEGEEAPVERSTERGSGDIKEMVTVLTSLDVASILTSGVSVSISHVTEVSVAEVPTGSGSIPTASPPGSGVPT
nr:hypothetical protein [Tanacetum cinerariifolium]